MTKFRWLIFAGVVCLTAIQSAQADDKAEALLQKAAATMQATHTLSAEFTDINRYPHPAREFRHVGTVILMRPNFAKTDAWIVGKSKKMGGWDKRIHSMTFASDGQTYWTLSSRNEYKKATSDDHGRNIQTFAFPTGDFFDPKESYAAQVIDSRAKKLLRSLVYRGTESWEGAEYQVVEWAHEDDYPYEEDIAKQAPGGVVVDTDRIYVGSDNLIHRVVRRQNIGWEQEYLLRNVRINASMKRTDFAFTLPPGAKPMEDRPSPPLLANGTLAPDFTVQDRSGKPTKLSDFRGKVVVLDFWATWCGPCQESLPHTNQVATQYKDRGVVVLAVNVWDTQRAFDRWLPQHPEYSALTFAIDPQEQGKDVATALYKVSGIPTQYVIDGDGKIAASFVGYEGPTEDLAKAIRAAQAQK